MKPKLLWACLVVLFVSTALFNACRKTSSSPNPPPTDEQIAAAKKTFVNVPKKVFSGHIPRTAVTTANASCFTAYYEMFYTITAIECPNGPGGGNDWQIDYSFYVTTDPEYCTGPRNTNPDPVLSNVTVELNGTPLSIYTPSNPLPTDGCGYFIHGQAELFSTHGIDCNNPSAVFDIYGTLTSGNCMTSPEAMAITGITPDLSPTACYLYQSLNVSCEVYPNVSPNNGEFWVFYPWDLIGCYSNTCFLPTDFTQIEIEYYKTPSGTHYFTTDPYFPTGPFVVTPPSGAGSYQVRARYNCTGGNFGPWSTWHSIPVN